MSRSSAVFMCFEIGASALAVCDRLIDELLQCFRLLLLRDGAHDGVTHDVAVPVNHIGGEILVVNLPASPSEAKYTF